MKIRFQRMIFILLCMCPIICGFAQQSKLIVQLKSGANYQVSTTSVKTITFSPVETTLLFMDWSMQHIATSDVQNLHFETITDDKIIRSNDTRLTVYPNPTRGIIFFKSLDAEINKLTIYTMNGNRIFAATLSQSVASLDLSFLQQGIYILKINNTQTRLIKL